MPISDAFKATTFVPAVAKMMPSMGLIVEYYIYDPLLDCSVRKRMRVGRLVKGCKGKNARLLAAQRIADEINRKLENGWSPLQSQADGRLYTPLSVLAEKWVEAKAAEGCRATTLRQYASVSRIFTTWCTGHGFGHKLSSTFVAADAMRYAEFLLMQDNRHCSFNNSIKTLKALFEWGVRHFYAKENPFRGVELLKKEQKLRDLVDDDDKAAIYDYFAKRKPMMNIVCGLVYSSAVRPIEATRIRIGDIDLEGHTVCIGADSAKNGHRRFATLSAETVELLRPVVDGKDGDWFLFGANDDMVPGKEPKGEQSFQKCWARMRGYLGLPMSVKLYSLRDTGFVDLIHAGADQLTVRQHADHSSLAMQDIYTNHADEDLTRKIFEKDLRMKN